MLRYLRRRGRERRAIKAFSRAAPVTLEFLLCASAGVISGGGEQRGGRISGKWKVNSEAERLYRLINHSQCFSLSSRFFGTIVICCKQRRKDAGEEEEEEKKNLKR